jgi:hypothetical protein
MKRITLGTLGLLLLVGPLLWASGAGVRAEAAAVTLEVLNPQGEIPKIESAGALRPRVPYLEGKKFALVQNEKPGSELMAADFEKMIKERFPTAKIANYLNASAALQDFAKNKPDVFIHFMGD